MRLNGKVAIITGGASGMGRSTAILFAREGACVVVADVDRSAGEQAVAEITAAGGKAIFQSCDMQVESQVEELVKTAEAHFGKLDILFNNAGIEQPRTPSDELDTALFERVIDVNLKGTFLGCKYAIQSFLRNGGGVIVNNSSVSAYANVGCNLSYAASKGAIMSLTRVLAIEYARRKIRVNAICPGVIDTGMNRRNLDLAEDPAALEQAWMSATPMGRMGTGEEIAETVLYLASDQSSFTTGIGLLIDGGRVAT
ncbi:MAG: glucose 1-dehydrogenase [Acidobacteriaceae bacterium]|nr:glucose 1-dehydrogenase [Acidobacteriaceae bacterium]